MYIVKKKFNRIRKAAIFRVLCCILILFCFYICTKTALFFIYCHAFLIVTFLLFYVPVLKIPEPSGNFYVAAYNLNKKIIKNNIHIWFPSDESYKKVQTKFYLKQMLNNKSKIINTLVHNQTIRISYKLSNKLYKHPVVIVSHGIGSLSNFYMAQIQELVSHGFVVIGINHKNINYFKMASSYEDNLCIEKILNDRSGNLIKLIENEVEIGAQEISNVIDTIYELNNYKKTIFYDKFDLNNIGLIGHSIGGAIVAETCRLDVRCKAGVSLDGSLIQKTADLGFSKPFMFIVGYLLDKDEKLINKRIRRLKIDSYHLQILKKEQAKIMNLCQKIGKDSYYITLKNAGHFAFTDMTLVSPIFRLFLDFYFGADHKADFTKKINMNLLSFFNKYLR